MLPLIRGSEKPHDFIHFWPNTQKAKALLSAWAKKCEDWPGGDHTALLAVLEELQSTWKPFPEGYASAGIAKTPSKAREKASLPQGWGIRI